MTYGKGLKAMKVEEKLTILRKRRNSVALLIDHYKLFACKEELNAMIELDCVLLDKILDLRRIVPKTRPSRARRVCPVNKEYPRPGPREVRWRDCRYCGVRRHTAEPICKRCSDRLTPRERHNLNIVSRRDSRGPSLSKGTSGKGCRKVGEGSGGILPDGLDVIINPYTDIIDRGMRA